MKYNRNPLYSAIKFALSAATVAAGTTLASATAFAQDNDEEAASLDRVEVTGSRLNRAGTEGANPVDIINREEIELSGLETVADVLRTTTYNSFGSYRERSGSSFQQIALVDLRGLGADRTAVLINGRRVPGNPFTGTSAVDINSIPLSAVERIEILKDSSSAIYGADAIGGVVNIIMRKDYEGAEIEIGTEQPTREGADADHFNVTFGAAGDKGSVLFSAEWYKKNPIFDADRDYSRVQVTPGPGGGDPRHSIDTTGVSSGGNTGFALDFSDAFRVGSCPTDLYIPLANPEGIPGAEGCGFGYADISMQTGGIERKSTFLNARYELSDNVDVYFENRYSSSDTFGRYAPAVGFFFVDAAAPLNPIGEDFFLFHRFVGHGNRDDRSTVNELDNVLGFEGQFAGGDIDFDFYVRNYEYAASEIGDTYVITSIIEDLVANGSYNFNDPLSQDPTHLAAVGQSAATLQRDIETSYLGAGLTLSGFGWDMSAGPAAWAVGFEIGSEDYKDLYDSFREAGNVLGSAGNSASGDRSVTSVFGELGLPLLDTLELNIAARYDDYDDFGSEFSPKVGVRYQPTNNLLLRASWGEGFKAPNLVELYSQLSQSFETVTDFTRCRAQGISDANCPTSQVEEYTGGNPSLQAEQSESFNVGAVFEPLDGLSFSLDYYNIEIDDVVQTLDLQDLINLEVAGTSLPPGIFINRAPSVGGVPGVVTNCVGGVVPPNCGIINAFANLAERDVTGLDLNAAYNMATDVGLFKFDLQWSHILEFDEILVPPSLGGGVIERPGTEGFPENKANLSVNWENSDYSVNYILRWIDSTEGVSANSQYPSFTTHDVTFVWHTPWGGRATVGVKNLTDEDPSIDSVQGYDDEVTLLLYDVAGRIPFASYTHTF